MTTIAWMRVLPVVDPDQLDTVEAELIVEWDADWQDWKVESLGAGVHRLSLYVTSEMLEIALSSLGESKKARA